MSLFFIASGAVMTDSSLAFCTTLTMISFWRALHSASDGSSHSKWWGYLFFVGLGIGLLAKGPLVGVLTFHADSAVDSAPEELAAGMARTAMVERQRTDAGYRPALVPHRRTQNTGISSVFYFGRALRPFFKCGLERR